MPLPRHITDAFGAVTVSLVLILVFLGLLCILYAVYFQSRSRQQGHLQLGYFNGPWLIRIVFILVTIWWGFGEIIRLRLLKGQGRLFTTSAWQASTCKFYIISNIGFAEPALVLMLVFLLRASLQKKDSGALSHQWNRRTVAYVILFCFPIFLLQLVLVFAGPKLIGAEEKSLEMKSNMYLTSVSSMMEDGSTTCHYPLMSTILLGLFHSSLIIYLLYIGFHMLTVVINKRLLRRIYVLILSVVFLLPLRVTVLGFSVLSVPGGFVFETLIFLAFLALLSCALLCTWVLVYRPVADSLALKSLRHLEVEELMPFDDYYDGASSLVVNQSHLETSRNSDASTKRGSISFRTMIRDDHDPQFPSSDGYEDVNFSPGTLPISYSPGSPYFQGRPLIPLHRVPES